MSDLLPGRTIEDVAFTGLLERLNQIAAVAAVVSEEPHGFERDDLLNMILQVGDLALEGVAFSGATQAEAAASFRDVMDGLTVEQTKQDGPDGVLDRDR